jgi:hypothetical protein
MIDLNSEQTKCLISAVNALKMILTGNFSHGFDPQHWHLHKGVSEGELKNIETQVTSNYLLNGTHSTGSDFSRNPPKLGNEKFDKTGGNSSKDRFPTIAASIYRVE